MPAPSRRPARRPWQPMALAASLVAAPSAAAAQQEPPARPTARLEYAAEAEACPNAAAFRREVATRLGYDPFVDEAGVVVRASIARGPTGLVGRVATADGAGHTLGGREISAPGLRCVDLVEAMAVATALAMEATPADPPPPPAATPPAASPAAMPPPEPPPREPYVAVRRASLDALGTAAAFTRLEATLAGEAADDRSVGVALGIVGGALGAVLIGLGTYALVRGDDRGAVGASLVTAGGGLVGGVILANVGAGGTASEVLAQLRAARDRGDAPSDAIVQAERTWARYADRHESLRLREGIVGISLGVLGAGGCAVGALDRDTSSPGFTVCMVAGAGFAFYGAWRLARRDAIERGWVQYQRARTPVVVPLATPAPSGATLGVAVTW